MARCNECLEEVEYLPDDNYCENCLDDFDRLRKASEKAKEHMETIGDEVAR